MYRCISKITIATVFVVFFCSFEIKTMLTYSNCMLVIKTRKSKCWLHIVVDMEKSITVWSVPYNPHFHFAILSANIRENLLGPGWQPDTRFHLLHFTISSLESEFMNKLTFFPELLVVATLSKMESCPVVFETATAPVIPLGNTMVGQSWALDLCVLSLRELLFRPWCFQAKYDLRCYACYKRCVYLL